MTEEERWRWRSRYDSINDFERMLVREDKHYKFSANDVRERRNWDAYLQAYEDAINLTTTAWAPWHIVPSDHKWYRNLVVARVVAETLDSLDPQWPAPDEDLEAYALEELEESVSSKR